MEMKLCNEGTRLDTIYMQSFGEWENAKAAKRSFAGAPKGESGVADSQLVKDAESAHTKAQMAYINHVVACSVCNASRYR